jgi:thioredoxin-related protein
MRTIVLMLLASTATAADLPLLWKSDYHAGRREAAEQGKAVCLVIGGERCVYCKKMDAVTFADPVITAALAKDFITIKIDGGKEAELVKALKVTMYPTTVLAGSDGTIHAFVNGYVEPKQMVEHLSKTMTLIADARLPGAELERLRAACKEADEKSIALQMQLAEALLKRGDLAAAAKCWERVVFMEPNSEQSRQAQLQLTQHKVLLQAVPASMKK